MTKNQILNRLTIFKMGYESRKYKQVYQDIVDLEKQLSEEGIEGAPLLEEVLERPTFYKDKVNYAILMLRWRGVRVFAPVYGTKEINAEPRMSHDRTKIIIPIDVFDLAPRDIAVQILHAIHPDPSRLYDIFV